MLLGLSLLRKASHFIWLFFSLGFSSFSQHERRFTTLESIHTTTDAHDELTVPTKLTLTTN